VSPPKKTMRPLDNRLSIAEAAADRIREAIFRGAYRQGERLSDLHIAEELETSRGPIREALKLLQAQGLVIQKPNRGTFVIRVSADDIRDACEIRVALESYAVRVLARQPREADLSALRGLLDSMGRAATDGDKLRVSQLDRDFHDLLCLRGGGRRFHEVYEREVLSTLGFFGVDAQAYQPISDMSIEFWPLLEAIETSNEDRAARLIEEHVRRACSLLSGSLEAKPEAPEDGS
jgi:GntR family transcriptional regulator of gluconate operon